MTEGKVLYQVKQILDYIPQKEYDMIPKEMIEYIENNYSYDKSLVIDQNIPLQNQNIDEQAYKYLERVIKRAELNKINMQNQKQEEVLKGKDIKISDVKDLIEEYKMLLKAREQELKELRENYNKIPKFIRKIFIKKQDLKKLDIAK